MRAIHTALLICGAGLTATACSAGSGPDAHFLPEFPPPIYLTTRKDLGDVSRGQLVTNQNFFELFVGILTPKDLDPALATPQELRGQAIFLGKGQCAGCHPPPIYSDNFSHDLGTERFYTPREISNHVAVGDGPIKTFPLRGIKDSPPYLHDGRLLTLEDTVEFFNLVLSIDLSNGEKRDLVAFMRAL